MEKSAINPIWMRLIALVVIILLSVEVVMLVLQIRQLKMALIAVTTPPMIPLKPGDLVQPIKLQTLNDSTIELSYKNPTNKYLLFIYSQQAVHTVKIIWRNGNRLWRITDLVNAISLVSRQVHSKTQENT